MSRFALLLVFILATMPLDAQSYKSTRTDIDGVDVVQLESADGNERVSIAVTRGNLAYEFLVNGKNAFYAPMESLAAFAERPRLMGNPLLWPWANRLDWDGYYFAGKEYHLNPALENVGRDGNQLPIPLDGSLLYVEPIYLRAETAAYPELRLVVVMHEDRLSYAETFEQALRGLFEPEARTLPPVAPEPGAELTTDERLRQAVEALQSYRRLQGEGRYEEAGRELERLQRLLER